MALKGIHAIRLENSLGDVMEESIDIAASDMQTGESGTVDAIYAYAAPGSAKPPLRNLASKDGCFPGLRFWTMQRRWFGNLVDLPVVGAGLAGYKHPYMDAVGLDVRSGKRQMYRCADNSKKEPNLPRGIPAMLHEPELYAEHAGRVSDFIWNISHIGMPMSYIDNPAYVAHKVTAMGWRLVESAFFEGTAFYGGIQSSFLIQSPDTFECMLTFKGTGSLKDVTNDLESARSHFCGLAEPCDSGSEKCKAGADESFVHRGFRDRLRQMVRTEGFQTRIRPKLSGCSKTYVVGHSLGAAMAELFAACVSKAPKPGDYGYESDYRYMSWTKSTPRPLYMN